MEETKSRRLFVSPAVLLDCSILFDQKSSRILFCTFTQYSSKNESVVSGSAGGHTLDSEKSGRWLYPDEQANETAASRS
jgi:hypothetical protein